MTAFQVTRGPAAMSETEKCAGVRARYHVYYIDPAEGQVTFDPIWQAETPDQAARQLLAFVRELGGDGRVVRVHEISPSS